MKNYMNKQDRDRVIVMLSMQATLDALKNSESLSKEQKSLLAKAEKLIMQFNTSVFDEYGEPFQRKIENTMKMNTLRFVSKYSTENKDCLSYCDTQDLVPKIKELQTMNCMFCEREDHKKCGMYAMCVALDLESNENENGCPFKL